MEATTGKFQLGLRDAAHRYGLAGFWRWWTGELALLIPSAPRTALRRWRMRPVLAFDGDVAMLLAPRAANGVLHFDEVARVALNADPAAVQQAGRAALEVLGRRAGGAAGRRVRVALPRSRVLRKEMTLPAVIEENLRQAIAYDLDRHTPFPADQLYFAAAVIARDLQRKEIRVDWAAAQRTHVDQALRLAESWGATVVGVLPEIPAAGADAAQVSHRLDLLPEDARPDVSGTRLTRVWLPLAAVVAVALVALALPVWQKRELTLELMQSTEQARVQAAAADAVRTELEQSTSDYNYVLERKYAYPPAVQLLEDVTRLLPDDTWILQFELKSAVRGKELQREMFLRGESASAGRLVSLLEESKLFEQASPRSPMTKIQPGPGEIFDVGAQLKRLAIPAKIELASLPTAAGAGNTAAGASAPVPAASAPAPTPVAGSTPLSSADASAAKATEPAASRPTRTAAPSASPASAGPPPALTLPVMSMPAPGPETPSPAAPPRAGASSAPAAAGARP
jgi:general secretion pathway protein L